MAGQYHDRIHGYGDHEYREYGNVYHRFFNQAGIGYILRIVVGGVLYFEGVLK